MNSFAHFTTFNFILYQRNIEANQFLHTYNAFRFKVSFMYLTRINESSLNNLRNKRDEYKYIKKLKESKVFSKRLVNFDFTATIRI